MALRPPEVLAARLEDARLEQVLFNSPSGDTDAGERGLAAQPGRQDEFRRGIGVALEYAEALGCWKVHVMAGVLGPHVDPSRAHAVYLGNLRAALDAARVSGVTLLVEPINAYDMSGYFLGTLAQAQAVVDELADDGLALQLDWYHAVRTEPDVVAPPAVTCRPQLTRNWPKCWAGTSPTLAPSTTRRCSRWSTSWGSPAGSVASTTP